MSKRCCGREQQSNFLIWSILDLGIQGRLFGIFTDDFVLFLFLEFLEACLPLA